MLEPFVISSVLRFSGVDLCGEVRLNLHDSMRQEESVWIESSQWEYVAVSRGAHTCSRCWGLRLASAEGFSFLEVGRG